MRRLYWYRKGGKQRMSYERIIFVLATGVSRTTTIYEPIIRTTLKQYERLND